MPKNEILYEAKTLEAAYEKASNSLGCSIINLDIEVIQSPTKGFFGMFSKSAIIKATVNSKYNHISSNISNQKQNKQHKKDIKIETLSTKLNSLNGESIVEKEPDLKIKQVKKEKIFDEFYESSSEKLNNQENKIVIKKENKQLIDEIKKDVNGLFKNLCYEIDEIKVDVLADNRTVYIEFSGEDSALLIGKEGYRYKALSYVLFNWINEKYNMMLRLEVAEFLSNQEQAIGNYLIPVIEVIKEEGYYKTKILDGILVHIALTKLRDEFPDKYVAVKTNQKGEKYILVNEYRN